MSTLASSRSPCVQAYRSGVRPSSSRFHRSSWFSFLKKKGLHPSRVLGPNKLPQLAGVHLLTKINVRLVKFKSRTSITDNTTRADGVQERQGEKPHKEREETKKILP